MIKIGRKSKVIIYDKRFIVNKDKGIVVCKLLCQIETTYKPFNEFIDQRLYIKDFPDVSYCMGFEVVGRTKCSKDDTFDETLGKRIAESKAKYKMFKKASNLFYRIADNVNRIVYGCCSEGHRYDDLAVTEYRHVEDLIKE